MIEVSPFSETQLITSFFKDKPTGRFLDIGAFGREGSNTLCLMEKGWSGVAFECNPSNFPRMREEFKQFPLVDTVCAAVMTRNGLVKFYDHAYQCGSTVANAYFPNTDPVYFVAGVSPEEIAHRFGDHFDFVALDIEGADLPVLKALGPVLKDTQLLIFENHTPGVKFADSLPYYQQMLDAAAVHGFTKVIGVTAGAEWGPANTVLAKP